MLGSLRGQEIQEGVVDFSFRAPRSARICPLRPAHGCGGKSDFCKDTKFNIWYNTNDTEQKHYSEKHDSWGRGRQDGTLPPPDKRGLVASNKFFVNIDTRSKKEAIVFLLHPVIMSAANQSRTRIAKNDGRPPHIMKTPLRIRHNFRKNISCFIISCVSSDA